MFGDLISAGANLISGWMNSNAQKDAAAAQERNALRNIEYQKEFAQSGLQWKAADAKAAGIHPLYAMGAAGASFAPVSIAGIPATGMGDAVARAGQNIGRAVQAAQPRDAQVTAISNQQAQLQLTNAGLQNELLAAQVAKAKQELISKPAIPALDQRWLLPGQGSAVGGSLSEKMERVPSDPQFPHREGYSVSDMGHGRTGGGGYTAIPAKDTQERIEDNWLQSVMWAIRNNLLPSIGINENPPNAPLPKGYDAWRYHPLYQEYRPHKKGYFGIHY